MKLDGLYLGVLLLSAATFARSIAAGRWPSQRRPSLIAGALALGALLLTFVPWRLYTFALGLGSDLPGTAVLQERGVRGGSAALRILFEELLFHHSNSAWGCSAADTARSG